MNYNVKDEEKVQFSEFCCPHCLTNELITALQIIRDFECIDLIADADVVTEVLRNLLNVEVNGKMFTIGMIDIDGGAYDYGMEYTLTINDDMTIWVEPTWREIKGEIKLYDTDAYITYLYGDCDSSILQKLEDDNAKVMIFDFEGDDV